MPDAQVKIDIHCANCVKPLKYKAMHLFENNELVFIVEPCAHCLENEWEDGRQAGFDGNKGACC